MLSRSFIDVLFILLLGTIVMLTHAVQLDEIDADLLRMGGEGTRPVSAADVQIVIVTVDGFRWDGRDFATTGDLDAALRRPDPVLLVVDGAEVRHRRVMAAWSQLHEAGFEVNLGAAPEGSASDPEDDPGRPSPAAGVGGE